MCHYGSIAVHGELTTAEGASIPAGRTYMKCSWTGSGAEYPAVGDMFTITDPGNSNSFKAYMVTRFESAQDANAMHGVDVEAEIMQALAQEIAVEIDQEMLAKLRALAPTIDTLDFNSGITGTQTYIGERHALLAILINRVANLIAARTRRGAGNYVVVSPEALTILQSATTSTFVRSTEGPFEAPVNSKFVGTLNGTVRVFVDNYAADGTAVLVGYKGSSETDAPAFYCPYIPLMSTGPVMDPSTFEPVVSFMTRYGYIELTNTASSLGNAADYLGEVALSNVSFK